MWRESEIVVSALLLSLSVVSSVPAKKPKPTPCAPDRYLLPSGISSLTGDSSTESVPLVLGTGQSSLGSCALKSGKAKANKKGITTLVAKSPPGTTCNGFKKVREGHAAGRLSVRHRQGESEEVPAADASGEPGSFAAMRESTRPPGSSATAPDAPRPPLATAAARASRIPPRPPRRRLLPAPSLPPARPARRRPPPRSSASAWTSTRS